MNPDPNHLWSRAVAQELGRNGIQHVCVSPGSRSTPLVLAFHAERGLRLTTHLDERSAAFFALGAAKATRRPTAVLTTSGTAAANLLPGVVEAWHSRVPLVVFTADRPPELHDIGANQSIDQHRLFGAYARWFADAGVPESTPERLRHVRSLVCRAVAVARGPPAGPVHLNFPFREPFEPLHASENVPADADRLDPVATMGRPDGAPYSQILEPILSVDDATLETLAGRIQETDHGLIVCGPRDELDDFPPAVLELSRRVGFPILADPLSGLRFGHPEKAVLSGYDAFLAHPQVRQRIRPTLILRFGGTPTSKSLLQYLVESEAAYQVVIDETGRRWDPTLRGDLTIPCNAAAFCRALNPHVPNIDSRAAEGWTRLLQALEQATWDAMAAEASRRPFEGAVVAALVNALPPNAVLYVSSSLPIRDLDRFARGGTKPLRVLSNRGTSGIDGVVSSAAGAAFGLGRKAVLLLGDLALLHDLNGLIATRRLGIPLDVYAINNDGGGIFEFLPIADHEPPFTELFATPHGLDLAALARSLGLRPHRLPLGEPIGPLVPSNLADEQGSLVEIASDRKENKRHRNELDALVGQACQAALQEVPHAP